MPGRTAADQGQILKTYERTGSGRETARVLGLHENTVYAALRRMRGKCLSCASDAATGRKYCDRCLEIQRERVKSRRADQKKKGLCVSCDERVEWPSRTLCAAHRAKAVETSRQYETHARSRRVGTHQGKPNSRQRLRSIRSRYGQGGLDAWERDGARCVICGASYGQATITIHHKDLTKTNNGAENLVCLCFGCHQLVHGLLRSRAPHRVFQWAEETYADSLR